MTFEGFGLEIDKARTAQLYAEGHSMDWCQCEGCTNARVTRSHFPEMQKKVLQEAGLDPMLPFHSAAIGGRPVQQGHTRRVSCWFAYGRLIGADRTPSMRFDRYNWMWVDTNRRRLNTLIENLDYLQPGPDADLLYFVASNSIPWLYSEMGTVRTDYVANGCPVCGGRWRETAYLKPRSRIPGWKGLPDLEKVLRDRKERIYVEICSRCGHMDYSLVTKSPPFRHRNTLLRDEQKLMGRYRYRPPL